ncbi:related to Mevalonate kinase [Hanseniaspora guilliermondii]|uniref:Mevalonate kinase n=1 Tax=Hanseniaspora guilliermondii TaxID=56406 RepID=A0A1L0CP70_9ASCO|nr:related to Mevalonate kinase [Hanseniaspora guilliermondii]
MNLTFPIITTAPGKVIISGEHSAVYGKDVVASAVKNLRCYLLVEDISDVDKENVHTTHDLELDFPDLGLRCLWNVEQDLGHIINNKENQISSNAFTIFNQHLSDDIEIFLKNNIVHKETHLSHLHHSACHVFLYLLLHIVPKIKNKRFIMKSNVPVGAGLGSSAAVSVCLVQALLYCMGSEHLSDLKTINDLSLLGEKCVHGTPSGIDNAVATYGKAIILTTHTANGVKMKNLKVMDKFPESLNMLLINTKIPKSTKTLVANVKKLHEKDNNMISSILDAMHKCTQGILSEFELIRILESEESPEFEATVNSLFEKIRINHGLLCSIGVSHPGLEKIKILSDELKIGGTKLTGAGGGGCAMTILDPYASEEKVDEFKCSLIDLYGYDVYKSQLGGTGAYLIDTNRITKEILLDFEKNTKINENTVKLIDSLIP